MLVTTMLVGCGTKAPVEDNNGNGDNASEVTLSKIHQAVKNELGENYISTMDMSAKDVDNIVDLDMDEVEAYIAQVPMMSTHVDKFIAVKAKPGEVNDVEEDLIEYREDIVKNSLNYPGNLAKVEASEVVTHGDYVFFIMLGAFDERDDTTEAEQLQFAKDEVAKIKATIAKFFE